MEEVIVEGFDYEDFVALKSILTNNTTFTSSEQEKFANSQALIEKAEKIIQIFNEE
jgi:hypothetical protein